jgi:hypothetical protein
VVDYSETFEKRFYKYVEKLDGAWDVLESAISALEHNPYSAGEPLLDYDGEELWIYQSPPISRLPRISIIYKIERDAMLVRALSILVT